MEIIAATNNAHKLEEMRRILRPMGHTLLSMAQAGLDMDPEENGATFAENALIKAQAVCAAAARAALADDSGLAVDALNGAPGIYSARYCGKGHDDAANNQKLLRELKDIPHPKRTAQFVCALALVLPAGAVLQVQGSCEGYIGFEPVGTGGFGYDPLFYVGTRSFAQLSAQEKDDISHRGRALRTLQEQLPAFLAGQE